MGRKQRGGQQELPARCRECAAPLVEPPTGAETVRCAYCGAEYPLPRQASPAQGKAKRKGGSRLDTLLGCAVLLVILSAVGVCTYLAFYEAESEPATPSEKPADSAATLVPESTPGTASAPPPSLPDGGENDAAGGGPVEDAGRPAADAPTEEATGGPPGTEIPAGAELRPGDPVHAFSEGRWYRAEIVRTVRPDLYRVRFLGYDRRYDENVPRARLRFREDNLPPADAADAPGRPLPEGTRLQVGDPVWAYSENQWYRAEVAGVVDDARYSVRYIGYDEDHNETVGPRSLRLRDD